MYFYHKEWTLFCLSSVQVLISMIFFTLAASHWTELKISKCWSNTIFYCFSDGLTDPPDSREHSREQKKSESDLVQTCDICDEDTTTTDLGAKPPSPLPQLDGASKTPGLCTTPQCFTQCNPLCYEQCKACFSVKEVTGPAPTVYYTLLSFYTLFVHCLGRPRPDRVLETLIKRNHWTNQSGQCLWIDKKMQPTHWLTWIQKLL